MSSKPRTSVIVTTLVLLVAVMQAYVGVSFARTEEAMASSAAPQQVSGILKIQGNKPIAVNGVAASTGATILSGATVETPAQAAATITIPGHGTIWIAPNTKFTVEFTPTFIKIFLIQGCVVLNTLRGTGGEIDNAAGVIGKIDPAREGRLDVCPARGPVAVAGDNEGLFGLGWPATVLIIGGGVALVVAIVLVTRDDEVSRFAPS